MRTTFISAVRSAANLLFPPRCAHCGADGSLFCEKCEAACTRLRADEVCRTCTLPSKSGTCEICFLEPPALDRAIAVFTYQPEIRDAITALKYNDIRAIAPGLGSLMADAVPNPTRNPVNAVVPVPVSTARLRSRGYNQSELLARKIATLTSVELRTDLLTRSAESPPQAKAASIGERAANVRDAFSVIGEADGLRILLIDDVMTTGATLNSCAMALKESGASWVGALVLAREL